MTKGVEKYSPRSGLVQQDHWSQQPLPNHYRFLIRAWLAIAASGSQFFLVTFCPILCCKGCMNTATDIFKLEEIAEPNLAKSDFAPCPG